MYQSTFPSSPHVESYLRKGRVIGDDETAQDMVNRIVATLAKADAAFDALGVDAFAERLGYAMDTGRVVFSTPIMTNAGRHDDRPLAACAVPPVDLAGDLAQVKNVVDGYHQAGMGTGFALGELDDPVGVLRHLNEIAVAGAVSGTEDRPVGNMAILPLSHPKAAEFIGCKLGAAGRGEDWKFNISVSCSDAEMRAAISGDGWERRLLIAAAEAAHTCADPGLLFADRMNEGNPTPQIGEYVSTAPCAEVGLTMGETCQFGYVNLGAFHSGSGAVPLDVDALAETVRTLVRALDDAVEASLAHYPHRLSAQVMGAKRKIGVGVCGLADLLLKAGLSYDSPDGRQIAQESLTFVNYVSKLASVELASCRGGCPAVVAGRSRYTDPDYLIRFASVDVASVTAGQWAALAAEVAETGLLRNSSTVAIPPTGRSAPVIGASTGIEPLFHLTGDHPGEVHPGAVAALKAAGRTDVLGHVMTHGKLPGDTALPVGVRSILATATQINPAGHLAMAAAVQECVDEAVSKTVNLPGSARSIDVYDTYLRAWELGCKGATVYVDGSHRAQPQAL